MQKTPLIIKELSIRKMPGLPQGLPVYKGLAPNINIIAGPNASGKSSTARLIQQIIWHNKTQGIQADSVLQINTEKWDIKIDSKNITVLREGIKDEFTGLPSAEDSGRYMLALHELFIENEGDLAKKIVKESIGGVDLDKARENLGYSGDIKRKGIGEFREYEKAQKDYNETEQKQRDLKNDEQQLDKLNAEKNHAEKAATFKEFYQLTVDYINARLDCELRNEEFENFPKVLEKVTGEEYKNLEELEKSIERCKGNIRIAGQEIEKNNKTISSLKIPETGVDDEILTELEERIEKASGLERDMHETENKISQFRAKEQKALKSIDESVDPSAFKGLRLDDVSGLDKFLDDAHKTLSEKNFLESELNNLEKDIEKDKDIPGTDSLNNGVYFLSRWLQEQKASKGISKKWLIALPIAGIVAGISAYFSLSIGLVAICLIIILSFVFYLKKPAKITDTRKSDYERTGLPSPADWTTEEVIKKIDELTGILNKAKYREIAGQRIELISRELESLQPRLDNISRQYSKWSDKLKLLPELPAGNLKNYSGMYWFLKHIGDWQQNHTEAEALKASKEKYFALWEKNIQRINAIFSEYKLDGIKDATQAKAIFKNLRNEENTRRNALEKIKNAHQIINDNQTTQEDNIQKLENIYNKLEINFGQKEEVKKLLEQLVNYKKSKQDYNDARVRLSDREKTMKAHSLYDYHAMEVETLTIDETERLIRENSEIASRLDEIKENITAIETRVKAAKEGTDLENALKEKDEAIDNLQQLYEDNLSSITGNLIVDKLKGFTRDKNRPKVFDHARKLLNQITNGRYDLILDDSDDAAFSAFDNLQNKEQPLNELSTGTRIQLLLAVRLAFIETIESSIKLPVMADELLANSDDLRAKSIIEALMEISKNGRQIFYFTAQDDEVAKWKSYLEEKPDIKHEVFTLSGSKNEQVSYDKSDYDFGSVRFIQQIPYPAGKEYNEYGREIGVEPYNLVTNEPGQLHLWYLLEDSDVLYNCLKLGIQHWGQLDSYLKNSGKIDGLNDNILEKIRGRIELLSHFQELYRKGRPHPISREILEESGTVTGKFIDAVHDKLKEFNYNPKKLLYALKNGEIARFKQAKTDELQQYFLNEGYIDENTPLSKDEILLRMQAFISSRNIDIKEAENFINRII